MVVRLNLNNRCFDKCLISSMTFHCTSQLMLVKCVSFCSENKITLNVRVTVTCNNWFFINFELNWWQEVSDIHFELLHCPPVSGVKFYLIRVVHRPFWVKSGLRFNIPNRSVLMLSTFMQTSVVKKNFITIYTWKHCIVIRIDSMDLLWNGLDRIKLI